MASTTKDVFKQDFKIFKSRIVVKDLSSIGKAHECEFELPVFGYLSDTTDNYKNDYTSPLIPLSNVQTNAKLFLEMKNGCTWEQKAQLNDSTYGYVFGSSSDPNIVFNGNRPTWIGYHLNWHNALSIHGKGFFRIRLEYDDFISGNTFLEYSYSYALKSYTDDLADGTCRYSYSILGGIRGNEWDDMQTIDYGTVKWARQIRTEGIFGYSDTQEYASEYLKEQSGAMVWLQDSSVEKYKSNLVALPHSLHQEFKKVVFHADKILVDDYNLSNITEYVGKRVLRDSNYEPSYDINNSYYPVELQFTQYYETSQNKRC